MEKVLFVCLSLERSKMKLAWLCYNVIENGGGEYHKPVIVFEEPDKWDWHKVVPIVYAEIVE